MLAEKIYYGEVESKNLYFYIGVTDKGLCFVSSKRNGKSDVKKWIEKQFSDVILEENDSRIQPYKKQLIEYADGNRETFQLPLDLRGTPFQESVWQKLKEIPYGETRTYSEVAKEIGKPNAVRAVASAIGKNPVLIVIPCHRVIGKNGNLSGFREGISMKKKLLQLENTI